MVYGLVIGLDAVEYVSRVMIFETDVQRQLTCEASCEQNKSKNSGRHCYTRLLLPLVEGKTMDS